MQLMESHLESYGEQQLSTYHHRTFLSPADTSYAMLQVKMIGNITDSD